MSIATLNDIDFVTALHAACDDDAPWPIATTPAQALAVADLYCVDGEAPASSLLDEPWVDAILPALAVLAKAYREAVL